MLHKSFKPAKCKTALKLAASRLKLLKNKKEVQVKQMKRELAQLLESGQDQTARIRVEHVVREEKMMAAFELVEIYCELIAARLPIIESQKNCPIDLKEAISSVVFASPRCADIPELVDIRKHFTAKYGKDFISAAVELRPDCGVSRTLVEKLSAKAPDGPTKVKILTSIAEEHNIKWDPNSFGDKDSHNYEDLLNGPSTFEKASKLQTQFSNFQVPDHDRERTNVQVAPQKVVKEDASLNLHENSSRLSFGHQNIPPGHANVPATSHPEPKAPGNVMEGAEAGHAYPREGNVDYMGGQNWNMEFKDATSAAQAAAESAERASMAARAAAQLSSRRRISTQYSTEPQRSSAHGPMDEWAGRSAGSSFQNEAHAKVAGDKASEGRNAQPHTPYKHNYVKEESVGEAGESFYEDDHMSNNRPSQYASMKSNMEPMDNNSFANSYDTNNERPERYISSKSEGGFSDRAPVNDTFEARVPSMHRGQPDVRDNDRLAGVNERYYRESHKKSSESSRSNSRNSSADFSGVDSFVNEHEMASRNTRNSSSGAEPGNVLDKSSVMRNSRPETSGTLDEPGERRNSGGSLVESANDLEDDFISAKHSTHASYYSHSSRSSTFNNNREVLRNRKEEDDVAENPFADFEEENFQKDNKSAIESTAVVFDDYDSDGDDYGFGLDKGAEPSVKTSQPSWESPSYPSASISTPSPKRTTVDTFTKITPQSSFSMDHNIPIFSEGLADSSVHSQADELEPVTFDESNGPSSESEEDRSNYKGEREYSSFGSQKKFGFGGLPSSSGKSSFNSKHEGLDTSDDPVDKKHQSQPFNAYEDALVHDVEESASVISEPVTIDNSKSSHEDSYDSGLGLTFGRLTGGLKNKGNRHPSYLRSSAGDASLFKQTAEYAAKEASSSFLPDTSDDSGVQQDPESEEVGYEFKKRPTRGPAFTSFGSGSDQIPEKTVPQESFRSRRERQVQKLEQEAEDSFTRRESTRPVIPSLGPSGVYASERTTQGQISDSHPEFYSQQEPEADERSSSRGSSASFDLREEQRGSRTRRERYIEKMQQDVDDNLTRRASTRPMIPSLGSDDGIYASEGTGKEHIYNSGPEPYSQEESEANKRSGSTGSSTTSGERIGAGLSRRTKAGAPSTHRNTNLKSAFASDESKERSADSRSSLRSSYPTETSTRPQSAADEAYSLRSSGHSRYGKEAKGEPISETKRSSREESSKSSAKVQPSSSISKRTSSSKSGMSEDGPKSTAREQPSLPIQKKVSSANSETRESSKAATPGLESTSREDSLKRASHVHPKLPDYDTFAATLQSLRANRQ
ncbi:uncharacterized protein LOC115749098 [Rhodamnia argentea]|uniref:Uncharacterized protein LOC115749098 n=1 Tax=Rhodamnia argentea TaxID=178133 RepID=A0A8B8Q5M7_9MYRT|nr:uncharacterized protein LOC115749098 [Rhodamnia argentea]